jgi:DNA-binding response OmpR family regulator
VHILLATDADWIVDEVTAALGGPDTSFTVCREGRLVSKLVGERPPDLAVLDLQVGSMGGMAIAMALRLDESGGLLPHVKVLMLLDRQPDVYLAQRSSADGWLIKPLDALRLKRAALAVVNGEIYQEGVPHPMPVTPTVPMETDDATTLEDEPAEEEPAEEEPAPAG